MLHEFEIAKRTNAVAPTEINVDPHYTDKHCAPRANAEDVLCLASRTRRHLRIMANESAGTGETLKTLTFDQAEIAATILAWLRDRAAIELRMRSDHGAWSRASRTSSQFYTGMAHHER